MLMIRLSRTGKKKYATYRIVIQEKSRDPWGKTLEFLGNYNPHTKEFTCKGDRIKYWISVGAQASATVNNLLIRKGIIEGKKIKAAKFNQKKKKGGDKKEGGDKPAEGGEAPAEEVNPEKKPAEEKKEKPKEEPKAEEKPTGEPKEKDKPAE